MHYRASNNNSLGLRPRTKIRFLAGQRNHRKIIPIIPTPRKSHIQNLLPCMASMLSRAVRFASARLAASHRARSCCADAAGVTDFHDVVIGNRPLIRRGPPLDLSGGGTSTNGKRPGIPRRTRFTHMVGREGFLPGAKDLESDKAMWSLYKRWCKAFEAGA